MVTSCKKQIKQSLILILIRYQNASLKFLLATAETNSFRVASHEKVVFTGPFKHLKTWIETKQKAFACSVVVLGRIQLGICHNTENL